MSDPVPVSVVVVVEGEVIVGERHQSSPNPPDTLLGWGGTLVGYPPPYSGIRGFGDVRFGLRPRGSPPRPDNRREYGTIPADCGPEDLSIPGYHLNGSMLRFRAPQDPGIRGKGKKKEGGEKREGKKRGKRGGLGDHICPAGLKLRTNVYKELRKEKKKKKERKREREGRKKRGEKGKEKGRGGGGREKEKKRKREREKEKKC